MRGNLQDVAVQPDSAQRIEAVEHQLLNLFATNAHARKSLAAAMNEQLPPSAVPILATVIRQDGITQSELTEELLMDKASLSRLVTRMVEMSLLQRTLDPADRRVSRLSATTMAVERWEALMRDHRQSWQGRLSQWPDDDIDRLVQLLSKLNSDFRAY